MDDEKSQTDQEESGNDLPPKNVSVADSDKENEIGSNKDDQGASGDHERWPHRVIAIFSTLLVLITGFYTFYASQQIDLTREGLDATKAALKETQLSNAVTQAGQRAFLSLNSISGRKVLRDGRTVAIAFNVEWENGGTTPAQDVYGRSNVQPWSTVLPNTFDFPNLADSIGVAAVVAPRGSVSHTLTRPIDELIDVMSRGRHLYFWGWIGHDPIQWTVSLS